MANTKISTLSSASTPLSGSEIVPINQSGTTDSVTVANLTVGRDVNTARLTVGTGVDALTGNGTGQVILTGAGQTLQTPGKPTLYHKNSVGLGIHSDYAIDIEVNGGSSTIVAYQVDPTGNIIQKVAGKGINFTANTPASGKTSQLLNWYEEGTWTMGLSFGGGTTGITYVVNTGRYIRIGKSVTVTGLLILSSKGSSTGAVKITGLPFSIGAGNESQSAGAIRLGNSTFTGQYAFTGSIGTTTIDGQVDNGATGTAASLTNTNFANNSLIQISYTYFVD